MDPHTRKRKRKDNLSKEKEKNIQIIKFMKETQNFVLKKNNINWLKTPSQTKIQELPSHTQVQLQRITTWCLHPKTNLDFLQDNPPNPNILSIHKATVK